MKHPNFVYYSHDGFKDLGEITAAPEGDNYKVTSGGMKFRKFGVYSHNGKRARAS